MSNANVSNKLGTEKVHKIIFKLAIPAIIAQVVNVLYNVIDRIYLGHIEGVGVLALTAVGVTFPIIVAISAFSAFSSSAGAPLAAIELGRKNINKAEKILGNCLFLLLIFSFTLPIICYVYGERLLFAFGATATTIDFALDYLNIYLIGTPFVLLSLGLNTFISSQGYAKTAMFSIVIGAFVNIILDPIFIFGFNMNVKGAALATIISQACSALWIILFLCYRSNLKIKVSAIFPSKDILKGIFALGLSPFIMQITESMIMITLNKGLSTYGGDLYLGGMAISQSIMQIISIPVRGFCYGAQPVVSYNYGAKNTERVILATKIIVGFAFITLGSLTALTMVFPEVAARPFTKDPELIKLIGETLPLFMSGMLIFGIQSGGQSVFLGIGQAKISIFLAILRKILLLIPLAIILPKFFGVIGIYYAEAISDFTSASVAGSIFLLKFKKILIENEKS